MLLRRRKTTVLIAPILLLSLVLSGCLGGNGGEKVTYFELQVGVSGSGSVSPLTGKQKYAEGTVVTLAATPTPDWEFRYWIGEVSDPYSPETELVVDGEKSVTAVFYKADESILIRVQDAESLTPVPGVTILATDGSDGHVTNSRGEVVLNTRATSTIVAPFGKGTFQPQASVAEKGEIIVFSASPNEPKIPALYELAFNPVEFSNEGETHRLNPFASAKIREAMNRLFDRADIANGIFLEQVEPLLTALQPGTFDHIRMQKVIGELEEQYSYDKQAAQDGIAQGMQELGAELKDGQWHYNGEVVELILIISDWDPNRIALGDYVATELESIGFKVEKLPLGYMDASMRLNGDPRDGTWHLATNAWRAGAYNALQSHILAQYYTPLVSQSPLVQAYNPAPELLDAARSLNEDDFASVEQRDEALEKGLRLSLKDSVRIWLVAQY